MALFKIQKGLSTDLATNRPDAVEGYCYFTTDDGLFYIDTVSGTLSGDSPTGKRVLLNAGQSAYASRALKDYDGNIISETYATKDELNNYGIIPLFYYETIEGNGSSTDFTITHNLGLTDVIAQVYDMTTSMTVECDIQRTSVNSIVVTFNNPPSSSDSYRVMIYGLDSRLISDTDYQDVIPASQKGAENGVAPLNSSSKIDLAYLPQKSFSFSDEIEGDDSTTIFEIEHNLNTRDLIVQIYDLDDYEDVQCGIIRETVNKIKVRFSSAVALNKKYKVLIQTLTSE